MELILAALLGLVTFGICYLINERQKLKNEVQKLKNEMYLNQLQVENEINFRIINPNKPNVSYYITLEEDENLKTKLHWTILNH